MSANQEASQAAESSAAACKWGLVGLRVVRATTDLVRALFSFSSSTL